jgi:membrane-bound metal-dependent hydrolase YbcI (DUF457 family)
MIKRTHLVIGLALGLYFLPLITHKVLFIPIVLLASVLPDVDSINSNIGRRMIFRPIQYFFAHRGPLHSYTIAIIFSILLAFFLPIFAFPFFLGYSVHIFADSFTVRGIRPFWPLKFHTSGVVKTGRVIDKMLFRVFVIINIFLFIMLFFRI